MYPEYKQVKAFFDEAKLLLDTKREMKDLYESIFTRNKKRKAAIYYNEDGKLKSKKYKKCQKEILAIAANLSLRLKAEKHNVIVLKASNDCYWGEFLWAILMCGYKPLLLDAKTSKEGAINIIEQSKAVAIVTDDPFQYPVKKFSADDLVDDEEEDEDFVPTWENELIFCSSGTTGDVKLMVYNGENIIHQVCASLDMPEVTKDIMYPQLLGNVRILAMIPFHHIFGFVAVYLWYTFYGKTIVYPASLAPSDIFSLCQKVGITHVYSVPLFWDSLALGLERKLALMPEDKQKLVNNLIQYNLGRLPRIQAGPVEIVKGVTQNGLLGIKVRFCISGGGYLNTKTLETLNGIGYPLYNGYGMTEVGVTSVELSPNIKDRLKGSIGKPLHGIEYKIVTSQENDEQGELLIKSPITHIREIIGGKEQPASLDENGYFHTGDIAAMDADGEYYIKGRIKDIIINANGENVFPDELELFFKDLPHVSHYSVLGVNLDNSTNQKVVIALEVDNTVSEEDMKGLVAKVKEISKNLPKGTVIDEVFFAKGKLPLANNMKVKRFMIKKAIEANNGEYVVLGSEKKEKKSVVFDKETQEKILIPMRDLFSKILVLPKFKIEDDAHWINDLGGDSMNYVELVRDIQTTFNVIIPESQYGQLVCINDFVEEVRKLLNE